VILPRRELLLLHHLTVIHLSVSSLPSPPLLFSSVQVTFLLSEKDVNLVVDSSKGKRVNRGLASNDHPGSFAGQWAGAS